MRVSRWTGTVDATEVTGELPVLASRGAEGTDGTYEVDLNGVSVQGELMTVVFTYRQLDGDGTTLLGGTFDDQISQGGGSSPGRFSTDGVYVLDPAQGTPHLAAYDSEERCVCSWGLHATGGVTAGGSLVLSTTFSAPPESTEVVDVVIPTIEVFTRGAGPAMRLAVLVADVVARTGSLDGALVSEGETEFTLASDVYFAFDSAALEPRATEDLRGVAGEVRDGVEFPEGRALNRRVTVSPAEQRSHA